MWHRTFFFVTFVFALCMLCLQFLDPKNAFTSLLRGKTSPISVYNIHDKSFSWHRHKDKTNIAEMENYPGSVNQDRCWTAVTELNRQQASYISPDTALCLFQPLSGQDYKRHGKKTVVLGISVHVGVASSQKFAAPFANVEYLNWEKRGKDFGSLTKELEQHYTKERLVMLQKEFWNRYRDDPDLKRTDIIVCGFDVWHCLIFAPFNKKMVINSAYRFEGHINPPKESCIEQQKIFYDLIRYNPDVILGGQIVYDVVYEQHFLGSHKLIPLPGTGNFVMDRIQKELTDGKCPGVPQSTSGYHPTKPAIISISPKRLSAGGRVIAKEMKAYFQAHPLENFQVQIMEEDLKKPYNYCDLGKYTALVVLGYSVMSYFSIETASLGIPFFAPSPRLYAEMEKKNHLIEERKSQLAQTSYDWMTENPRSINKGYNPNDDFNITATERWLGYSSYFFYKGVIAFDNFEDLRSKILKADFKQMNQDLVKHTETTASKSYNNMKAVDRYFHGYKDDVISSETLGHSTSLEEGLKNFEFSKTRPKFDGTSEEVKKESTWVLIDYELYTNELKTLPDCQAISDTIFGFYMEAGPLKVDEQTGCHLLSIQEISKSLPEIFKSRNPKWRKQYFELVSAIHATQHGASNIVRLLKGSSSKLEVVDSKFKRIFGNASGSEWRQQTFKPLQLWLLWTPVTFDISRLYSETLLRFTDNKPLFGSMQSRIELTDTKFSANDINTLKDYLNNWISDERENFFHLVDQFNFELAVKGYLTKSNAVLHRLWLLHLSTLKFNVRPKLKT